jgi:hypothetical protein
VPGQVKESFGDQVEVEIVYKGLLSRAKEGMPNPPNIAVGGELLGKRLPARS